MAGDERDERDGPMTAAEAERAHLRGPAGSADPNHAPTFIGRHDLDDGAQFLG